MVWSIVSKKELVPQAVRRINTREKKHFKAWEDATNPEAEASMFRGIIDSGRVCGEIN